MSGQQRHDRPRPPRTRRRGRVRASVVAISGVVALTAALVLPHVNTMAWFGVGDGEDAVADAGRRLLDATGETPGERVVEVLVSETKLDGFKAGKTNASVSDAYALTCLDGAAAWSSARTRTLRGADGEVVVSALVHPAGGGGAAFAQAFTAADRCAEDVTETEHGVDGAAWRRGRSAVQTLRRGDVVVVVSSTTAGVMPSGDWFGDLDVRLSDLLAVDCIDDAAPPEAALRNPFIDPEAFTGNTVADPVAFPRVELTRADDVATDPVVPLDSVPPVLPEAVEHPEPLDPVASELPDLPAEVERPEAPVPPVEPDPQGVALRGVADSAGPGCGWDFTGQAGPRFDAAKAESAHAAAVEAEQTRLVDEAVAFEQGKVNFYRAWVEHQIAVASYEQYMRELTGVLAQWQVVIDARAQFVAAFETYRAGIEAFDDFAARQATAQVNYDAELVRCQSLSPLEVLIPGSGCPPERPAVLDEVAPVLPARPVPAPQAQLPVGWEPPVQRAGARDGDAT